MEQDAIEFEGRLMPRDAYDARITELRKEAHQDLARMRDRWVQHRAQSGVEDRWRRAAALYFGDENMATDSQFIETLKTGPAPRAGAKQQARSRVVVNIVRPKVDQAVARMCEILLPVDDRCWGIKPTPVPDNVSRMLSDRRQTVVPGTSTPTGMRAKDEAQAVVQAADEAAKAAQDVIDDLLVECRYNAAQRDGIEDGVRLGTMVLKGPFPTKQTSRVWQQNPDGTSSMAASEKKVFASARRDPWDVWFDPSCGNNHQRGAGAWERRFVTRKELRALIGVLGFDAEAIRAVLLTPPTRVHVAEGRVSRLTPRGNDESYELWEYHGEIEPDAMRMCSWNTGDPLDVDFGVLTMVNDICISATESWVPDRTLPYDVWCWRKADDSPYGFGLPSELEHQQRVVTAAWRQVMDNARVSSGSQTVFKRKMIKPVDGSYEVTPNKMWEAGDDVDDVRKAFFTFDFPSHTQEFLAIATTAMAFADQETSMPQLMNGEQGTAPETVGGMVMLYNNANTVLRMRVKLYDDDITVPHLGRHYDVQMATNPTMPKGDSEVDARGSTALLERDIQNQAVLNLANVTSNPRYQPYLDPRKELTVLLKAFRTQPKDLMLSDDKIRENEENPPPQPVDPRVASAQIKADTDMAKLGDNREARALQAEQVAYNRAREQGEFEIAMTEAAITRDTTLLKLDNETQLAREARASAERLKLLDIDTKRQIFNAEAHLRTSTGQGI